MVGFFSFNFENYVNIFVKQCLGLYSVAIAKHWGLGHLSKIEVDLAHVLDAGRAKNMV